MKLQNINDLLFRILAIAVIFVKEVAFYISAFDNLITFDVFKIINPCFAFDLD